MENRLFEGGEETGESYSLPVQMNVVIGDEDKGLRRHDEGAWA